MVVVVIIAAGLWWYFGTPRATEGELGAPGSGQTNTTPGGTAAPVVRESRPGSSVAAVVASIEGSTFNSLFVSTGVAASLTGAGPYTVFVPVNQAFNNLPPATLSSMTAAQKKRLVQYHVVVGKVLDVDAVSTGNFQALSKDSINFSVDIDQGMAFVNSGLVIKQYKASNGVVYLVGAVMVPPEPSSSVTP